MGYDPSPEVDVYFDPANNNRIVINDGDIEISKRFEEISFRLNPANIIHGFKVEIAGIEFNKPDEPKGDFAPGKVFAPAKTIYPTHNHRAPITVYGNTNPDGSLLLDDADNVTPNGQETSYKYAVWIRVTNGNVESYFRSNDPQIKNKPTTQPNE